MSWLKTLALLIRDATTWTRPLRNRNRWTRFVLASMVILAVMPALLVDSGRAADTGVTFSIGNNVSAADASWVMEGVTMAHQYVTETLTGFSEPLVVNIRDSDDTTGRGAVAFYGGDYIVVFTGSPGWAMLAPFDRIHVVVHEYIHAWQDAAMRSGENALPAWLIEGSAEYLSYEAVGRLGLVDPRAVRDYHAWAVQSASHLSALEDLEARTAFYGERGPVYSLGYLAIDTLLADGSPDQLVGFARRVRLGQDWRDAFAAEFGQDLTSFYRRFATYRSDLIAPARMPDPFAAVYPVELKSPVSIDTAPAEIAAGDQLLVLGDSQPGAICQFSLDTAESASTISGSTFADASGRLFWLVTVPDEVASGSADITANCGAENAHVPVEIDTAPSGEVSS
jgi:hypothetical protein